jgi:uridine phosphorylase
MIEKEYHINLSSEDIGKYVLMPGDPKRVEKIAGFLDNPVFVGTNREYTTYLGYLQGERVTVISSGIGGPSAAIAVEELHNIGAHTIIRIGTCGSMQPEIKNGSLIISSGSVRGGKTGEEYLPAEYPAVPHPQVLQALVDSSTETKHPVYVGITHCKDAFFKEEPEKMPDMEGVTNYWRMLRRANVLCSEMESDTLFLLGSLRNMRTGAIFSAIGSVEGLPISAIVGIEAAIQVTVKALSSLILQDKNRKQSSFGITPINQNSQQI